MWKSYHAWKACKRQKRFGGSNPPLSAENKGNDPDSQYCKMLLIGAFCSRKVAKRLQRHGEGIYQAR